MALIDLSDFTEAWRANEASGALVGYRGVQNLSNSGAIGSTTGHVGDPSGTLLARGTMQPVGGTTNSLWFSKSQSQGDIFDIRGQTSCTFAGWYKIKAGETGEPYLLTIHNPSNVNGQALFISTRHAALDSGAEDDPGIFMLDGLSAFNNKHIEIAADAASVPEDTWQFVCGGYDAARNKVFGFWGRGVGDSYYNEADGFAAGFGYDAKSGTIAIGQYRTTGGNGIDAEFWVDQCLWWKGRALTQAEAEFLWNNHVGRRLDDLVEQAPVAAQVCREPITIVEIDQDQCRLIYGESPCGAVLGTSGDRKCYNTRATCQDRENYDSRPPFTDQEFVAQDVSRAGAQEATKDVSTEDAIPTGVTFKRDGTKLYIIGQDSDQVRQYPLTTPWDISSAGSVEASFSVASEDTSPQALFFSPDGERFYIVGTQNDQVRQYDMSTPWDLSTASHVSSHDVSGEDTSPQGLFLKHDGSKLYVCGSTSQSVHQYDIATPWSVSTAGAVEETLDVSDDEISPQGIFFNALGTKLYLIGTDADKVFQYPLSTPWDISTSGAAEATFDVSAEEFFPSDLAFSAAEDKLYIVGVSGFVRQYPIVGAAGGIARDAAGTGAVDTAGSVEASHDPTSEETSPRGMTFKPDGTVLYISGPDNDEVHEYELSTPWDISTAGSVGDSWGDGSTNWIGDVAWKPDGTKIYVLGVSFGGSEQIRQHAVSTPWDLTTVNNTPEAVKVVSGEETIPSGLFFKADGTKVYITGTNSDKVHQYPLGTAWDLSTAGAVEASFDVSSEDTVPTGIFLRSDGAKLYVVGASSDDVHQYPLSTAWDISTAGAVEASFDVSGEETTPWDVHFHPDGTKLYIVGTTSGEVHQYPIPLLEGTIDGAEHVRSYPTGFSQALRFDGVDDSVEVLDANDRYGFAGTSAFTVEFIIEPTTIPFANSVLISKTFVDVSGVQGWRIRLRQSDTKITFERLLNGASDLVSASVSLLEARFWSCVYDGTDLILYEEGLEKARVTSSKSITTSGAPLYVGNTLFGATTEVYHGNIDELRIWQDERTEAEIRSRMVLPLSGLETDLVSYFPFDTNPIGVATRTLRFAKPQTTLPKNLYLLPLVTDVDTSPTRINPGGGSRDRGVLGDRAAIDVGFKDAPGSDRILDKYREGRIDGTAQVDESGYQPLDRGSFWTKWRARNPFFQNRRLRVLEGYIAERLRDMQTREYFIDQLRGPDNDGRTVIRAKDVLKLADDDRAQAPRATPGEVSASLSDSETTSFQATGALVDDYPDEPGLVRINDEIIEYQTRTQVSANNVQFNTLTRGARGSTAAAHDAEDRVQRCLEFVNALPWELAETLLVDFGNVPQDFIPVADWAAEGDVWLQQFTLSAVISEPTSVTKLLSEITQQAQFFLWWDEYTNTVKLKALRPPIEDPIVLNDVSHIIANASALVEHPNQRISQVWVFFRQKDPTKDLEDESNYSRVRIRADLEAEAAAEYGEARIAKLFSRWLETENQVLQVTKRTVDRYRNNPRTLKIRIDAKDRESVRVGDIADVTTRTVVDERGVELEQRWQVISTQEEPAGEAVSVELLAFEFDGNFAFYMESSAPLFSAATDAEKRFGAWYAEDNGQMPDGSDGYEMQ